MNNIDWIKVLLWSFGIMLICVLINLYKPQDVKAIETEYKIFTQCIEGKKFVIAIMKNKSISVCPINDGFLFSGTGKIQKDCE
jgi:hypothetical protein